MSQAVKPIRAPGRIVLLLLGLIIVAIGVSIGDVLGTLVALPGLILALAAIGVAELAMALWYRAQRTRT